MALTSTAFADRGPPRDWREDVPAAEPEAAEVAEPEYEAPCAVETEAEHFEQQPASTPNRASRTMRRDGPELWDLERDFERRQAMQ